MYLVAVIKMMPLIRNEEVTKPSQSSLIANVTLSILQIWEA